MAFLLRPLRYLRTLHSLAPMADLDSHSYNPLSADHLAKVKFS
jgi:hypothetical protein